MENISAATDIDRVLYLLREGVNDERVDVLNSDIKLEHLEKIEPPFQTEAQIRENLETLEKGEQIKLYVDDGRIDGTSFLIKRLTEQPCPHMSLFVFTTEEGSSKYLRKDDGTYQNLGSTEYFDGWVTGARCRDCNKEWGNGDGNEQELANLIKEHVHKSIEEPKLVASPKSTEKNTR